MTGLLTTASDPFARPGGLASFLLHRMTAAVLLALLTTAVVLVGVHSGDWGGTVSLEHHDPEVAEEAPDDQDAHPAAR